MVRNASRALKIGVHSPFDPNLDVGFGTFYFEKFWQAYWTVTITQSLMMTFLPSQNPSTECLGLFLHSHNSIADRD